MDADRSHDMIVWPATGCRGQDSADPASADAVVKINSGEAAGIRRATFR
jgi:hypothetical protein